MLEPWIVQLDAAMLKVWHEYVGKIGLTLTIILAAHIYMMAFGWVYVGLFGSRCKCKCSD